MHSVQTSATVLGTNHRLCYTSNSSFYSCTHMAFLTDPSEIQQWLTQNCDIQGTLKIKPNGVVDVLGTVTIKSAARKTLTHFAVQFGSVSGAFDCRNCRILQSLVGSPHTVNDDFYCQNCPLLQNLLNGPRAVGGYVYCSNCEQLELFVESSSRLYFNKVNRPSPDALRSLLQYKVALLAPDIAWVRLVNNYSLTRDLLQAAAHFEKIYKEPLVKPPVLDEFEPLTTLNAIT